MKEGPDMHAHDERGASAVEYGLLVAGIGALVVAIVLALGGVVHDTLFDPGCDELVGHIAASGGNACVE
jgi:pilus assembly protein Flp/PilA